MQRTLPLAGVMLALLLSACAGQPPAPSAQGNWDEHSARMKALTSWDAEGKLALRTPTQSESANVQWQQQGDTTRLKLNGPLGVAATSMYSNGRILVIRQGEESSTLDLADPAALRRQHRLGPATAGPAPLDQGRAGTGPRGPAHGNGTGPGPAAGF